jgi:hypothetical protein
MVTEPDHLTYAEDSENDQEDAFATLQSDTMSLSVSRALYA